MNRAFVDRPTTIFDVMSRAAVQYGAVNLGQGFPDADGPEDIRRAAAEAVMNGPNQYPPMRGLPLLREAIAEHYGRIQGIALNPETEVVVTSGATEALAASLLSLLAPGDEVVVLEPAYDAYLPLIERAGAIPVAVRLEPPHFELTEAALAAAFSDKTKAVVLNTPCNPSTRLYGPDQLELLARFCIRHDVVAVSDEVWEHVVFDGRKSVSMLSIPGMRERTIKIGSAGKMFSLTGWKVGFACAAPPLADLVAKGHQFMTFTTPPNLQVGVAYGLSKPESALVEMQAALAAARDRLAQGLAEVGYRCLASEGAYFLNVDLAASGLAIDDDGFCRRAVAEAGVAAIPISAFYSDGRRTSLVRLCFAKRPETIDRGVEAMAKARRLFG
jgi:aspartate/methionine/tyrosine aminotransferase